MIKALAKINRLLQQLNEYPPLTPGEVKRLKDEFLVEFTYNTNAIEGNTLTLQETALIINEGITIAEKPLKEHLEVIGHRDAYFYVATLSLQGMHGFASMISSVRFLAVASIARETAGTDSYRD